MLKKDNAPNEPAPDNIIGKGQEAQENQNIKKVREILFGRNINDIEKRFSKLEEQLTSDVVVAKKQAQALYENLEQYLKTEIGNINENLTKKEQDLSLEVKSLAESINVLKNKLSSFEENSTSQFRRDYESLVKKNEDILDQVQREGKNRIDSLQHIETEINGIKSLLDSQDVSVRDMRNNIYKQLFDQNKLVEKKFEEEGKKRTSADDDLHTMLDALSKRLVDFRTEADRSFGNLNETVKTHDSTVNIELPETLRNLERRNADNHRTLKTELDDLLTKVNTFAGKTGSDFKDMRESVHAQIKNIRLELEQQNVRLSQKFRSEQDLQKQQKVDRNALAIMFSELAMRLGEEQDDAI